jgi:SAM-dependent methyltransferase
MIFYKQIILKYPTRMRALKKIKSSLKLLKYGIHDGKLKPEDLYESYSSNTLNLYDSSSLDLGCGSKPRNPFQAKNFYGIDLSNHEFEFIKVADLAVEPIPFSDNQFDYITAFDFIEHIPRVIYNPTRKFPFVMLMNEIHRCLKPNGFFLSHTPAYPHQPLFRDPTHVNYITEETFPIYFDNINQHAQIYGFTGSFKVIKQGWNGFSLVTLLQKTSEKNI